MGGGNGESQMTVQKNDKGSTLPPLPKINKSMVVVCYLATKNNRAMLSFMAFV